MTKEEAGEIILRGEYWSPCVACSSSGHEKTQQLAQFKGSTTLIEPFCIVDEVVWVHPRCLRCHGFKRVPNRDYVEAHRLLSIDYGFPALSERFRYTAFINLESIRLIQDRIVPFVAGEKYEVRFPGGGVTRFIRALDPAKDR